MTRLSKTIARVGIVLVAIGVLTVLFAVYEVHHPRQTVLEAPIRFENGISIAKSFTVDLASNYWLAINGIKYPSGYKFSLTEPTPADPFVAHFRITSDGKVVADGDNQSNSRRPAALRRDDFSRFIADFPAEPRHTYNLDLRFDDVAPETASTPANIAIYLDFHVREGANYLSALLKFAGIAIALLGLLLASPLWYFLARRLLRRSPTT